MNGDARQLRQEPHKIAAMDHTFSEKSR